MSATTQDDKMLREAEKVERIANDVKRKIQECRRATAKASRDRTSSDAVTAAQEAVDQLSALTSGLEAMNRAVAEKYLDGDATPQTSYSRIQLENSLAMSKKIAQEARTVAPKVVSGATFSSSRTRQGASPPPQSEAEGAPLLGLTGATVIRPDLQEHDANTTQELRELASEAREIRLLQEHLNQITHEQGAQFDTAETNIDEAGRKIEKGRKELSIAAKYKFTAMTMTGAVVGGLIAGPMGMLAGAKSAATVLAFTAAGTATGAIATKQMTNIVKSNLDRQQDDLRITAPVETPARRALE